MINLYPIEVPGYVITFLRNELQGVSELSGSEVFSIMTIEPNSVFGMFLRRRIAKDYKVKEYRLAVYTKKIGCQNSFSAEILEYQRTGVFNVDLTFNELDDFFKFIDYLFRQNLYFFVEAAKNFVSINDAIRTFIDKYDLLEYGYSLNQLRKVYNDFRKNGAITNMQKSVKRSLFI